MYLDRLTITDFRCLSRVELDPHPITNLLIGPNASGKTSVLEAMFVAGRGRSFRTRQLQQVIKDGARRFALQAGVSGRDGERITIGIGFGEGRLRARIGGKAAGGLVELARWLPIQAIDSEVHELIAGGPGRRRRFLDWGVFHVEPGFIEAWRAYRRALSQRNAGLKQGLSDRALTGWSDAMARSGEAVAEYRQRYVDRFAGSAAGLVKVLLAATAGMELHRGWAADRTLREALERSLQRDRRLGSTQVGPHRADLIFHLDGKVARHRVSRGQQKLLAAGLLLAQMSEASGEAGSGVLLVDDPAAELDQERVGTLYRLLSGLDVQLFVTGLSLEAVAGLRGGSLFHVERGSVIPAR